MKIFGVEGKTTPPGKLKEGCLTMKPMQLLPPPFLPPSRAKPMVPRQACFPFVNLCEQLFCRVGWCPTCKLRLPIKSENKPLQSVTRNYVAMINEEMTHQGNDTPGKSRVSNPLHPQMNSFSTALPVAPPRNPAPPGPAAPPSGPALRPRPAFSFRMDSSELGGGRSRPWPRPRCPPPHLSAQPRQDRFTAGGVGGS